MKTLVAYYSHSNNNRFIAQEFSKRLKCSIEEIKPRGNLHLLQLLFSGVRFGFGISSSKYSPADFDRVIICSPIWMGTVVYPVFKYINKYSESIKKLYFISCCGSTEEQKDSKFGYDTVFKKIEEIIGDRFAGASALPIAMLSPETENVMQLSLNDSNFQGEINDRFEKIVAGFE